MNNSLSRHPCLLKLATILFSPTPSPLFYLKPLSSFRGPPHSVYYRVRVDLTKINAKAYNDLASVEVGGSFGRNFYLIETKIPADRLTVEKVYQLESGFEMSVRAKVPPSRKPVPTKDQMEYLNDYISRNHPDFSDENRKAFIEMTLRHFALYEENTPGKLTNIGSAAFMTDTVRSRGL